MSCQETIHRRSCLQSFGFLNLRLWSTEYLYIFWPQIVNHTFLGYYKISLPEFFCLKHTGSLYHIQRGKLCPHHRVWPNKNLIPGTQVGVLKMKGLYEICLKTFKDTPMCNGTLTSLWSCKEGQCKWDLDFNWRSKERFHTPVLSKTHSSGHEGLLRQQMC